MIEIRSQPSPVIFNKGNGLYGVEREALNHIHIRGIRIETSPLVLRHSQPTLLTLYILTNSAVGMLYQQTLCSVDKCGEQSIQLPSLSYLSVYLCRHPTFALRLSSGSGSCSLPETKHCLDSPQEAYAHCSDSRIFVVQSLYKSLLLSYISHKQRWSGA